MSAELSLELTTNATRHLSTTAYLSLQLPNPRHVLPSQSPGRPAPRTGQGCRSPLNPSLCRPFSSWRWGSGLHQARTPVPSHTWSQPCRLAEAKHSRVVAAAAEGLQLVLHLPAEGDSCTLPPGDCRYQGKATRLHTPPSWGQAHQSRCGVPARLLVGLKRAGQKLYPDFHLGGVEGGAPSPRGLKDGRTSFLFTPE